MKELENQIFISYAEADRDIADNLRYHFKKYMVGAWTYNSDKTPGEDTWAEIVEKIERSKIVLWLCSSYSNNSKGQIRELSIVEECKLEVKPIRIPVLLRDTKLEDLPVQLQRLNYLRLSIDKINSVTLEIIKTHFPKMSERFRSDNWFYPNPSDWLEVVGLFDVMENCFELGDLLYFRRLSPMGLFECYSPQIEGLYWLPSNTVKLVNLTETEQEERESLVPFIYTISAMIDADHVGFQAIKKNYGCEDSIDGFPPARE